MAHGAPDYGVSASKSTVYSLQDMAELAARLGSIVTFDRRGDVIWFDDFEDGIGKWSLDGLGTGNAQEWSSVTSRSRGFSLKLTCGSDNLMLAVAWRLFAFPTLSKHGFEFSFSYPDEDQVKSISIWVAIYDGVNILEAELAYEREPKTLKYYGANYDYVNLRTDLSLYGDETLTHTFKLVLDPIKKEYVRAIVNERTYDLSGNGMPYWADDRTPRVEVLIGLLGVAGVNCIAYIDDFIFTQNEP